MGQRVTEAVGMEKVLEHDCGIEGNNSVYKIMWGDSICYYILAKTEYEKKNSKQNACNIIVNIKV